MVSEVTRAYLLAQLTSPVASHSTGARKLHPRQQPQISLSPGDTDAVQILAQRHGILACRDQQVADLGHRQALALGETLANQPTHLGLGVRVQVNVVRDAYQLALGAANLEQIVQAGSVAAGRSREAGWLRRLETSIPIGSDQLVLELAEVAAQLGLEVGPTDATQVADQLFPANQPINGGMHQPLVANVIQLRLYLLSVVGGHEGELLMQPVQCSQQTAFQLMDHVLVQQ